MKTLIPTLISTILCAATTTFAGTNMMLPILKCNLSKADIQKIKDSRSHTSDSFTILADFESLVTSTNGKAILIDSDSRIGAEPSEDRKLKTGIGSGSFGTFYGTQLQNEGIKSGIIFKGDLLIYNQVYKSQDVITLKISPDGKTIKAERKAEPKGTSGYVSISNYNCDLSDVE